MFNNNEKFNKDKLNKSVRITYKVFWNLFLLFIIILLVGLSFAGGVGAGYFASLVKDEPIRSYESMKKDIYNYEETTYLYFANNEYLGKLRTDLDREEVKLDEVSEYVKKAVIATEDEYFYKHSGVVPKAIMRALIQEVTNASVKSGGSTLTQQLIKNQILTNEVSFERKAKEILLALRLERFFEKDEILEAYLNVVTFGRNSSGRNIAGIQAAAQGIFGVDAKDLNLPQAAYIAGLPQSPFGYTPFNSSGEIKESIEPGLNRMKTVLRRMLDANHITQKQYKEALKYDIKGNLIEPKPSPVQRYPWLTFEIEKRATEKLAGVLAAQDGYSEEDLKTNKDLNQEYLMKADRDLRRNGYRIYTTIDKDIYDLMQNIKNNYEYYGNDKPETIIDPETGEKKRILEPVEVGGILIENNTGAIISFIGGRDHAKEQLNHATRGERSNGSTMKPLLVYAPAFEYGIAQPGSVIPDVKLEIQAGPSIWEPENYGGGYHGFTSARYALARSYNIPAAKVYSKIIDQKPVTFLKKMGFSSLTEGDYSHLSMALGALDNGVTVEENVNAYATFANEGKFIDAYMIEKIETKEGDTIYQHDSEPVEVFTPQTAYLTLDMMRDVINRGTAAGIPGRLKFTADWAGKTGTSQDYRDAWFVATNPNITFGLWMGYDTPKPLERSYKGYSYSQRNQKLWAELMNGVYELNPELVAPEETFKMPGGIVRRSYCAVSGLLPSQLCEEAGLIETDIYNSKFVPSKIDDSLEKGKYVVINEKKYKALETTPTDFVKEGIMIKQAFLEEKGLDELEEITELIPNREQWENIVVPKPNFEENGMTPYPIQTLALANNTLTWEKHTDPDIVGYYVYRAAHPLDSFKKIAAIPTTAEKPMYTVKAPGALFYVTAVDIAGKESLPSNSVPTMEAWEKKYGEIPLPDFNGIPGKPSPDPGNGNDENQNDNESGQGDDSTNKPKSDHQNQDEDSNDENNIPDPLDQLLN